MSVDKTQTFYDYKFFSQETLFYGGLNDPNVNQNESSCFLKRGQIKTRKFLKNTGAMPIKFVL